MRRRFKTQISRGDAPAGLAKVVVGIKSDHGTRWEFIGMLPDAPASTLMALLVSRGQATSLNKGSDEGIAAAFGAGAAHG